jgi:hypothetical protein
MMEKAIDAMLQSVGGHVIAFRGELRDGDHAEFTPWVRGMTFLPTPTRLHLRNG